MSVVEPCQETIDAIINNNKGRLLSRQQQREIERCELAGSKPGCVERFDDIDKKIYEPTEPPYVPANEWDPEFVQQIADCKSGADEQNPVHVPGWVGQNPIPTFTDEPHPIVQDSNIILDYANSAVNTAFNAIPAPVKLIKPIAYTVDRVALYRNPQDPDGSPITYDQMIANDPTLVGRFNRAINNVGTTATPAFKALEGKINNVIQGTVDAARKAYELQALAYNYAREKIFTYTFYFIFMIHMILTISSTTTELFGIKYSWSSKITVVLLAIVQLVWSGSAIYMKQYNVPISLWLGVVYFIVTTISGGISVFLINYRRKQKDPSTSQIFDIIGISLKGIQILVAIIFGIIFSVTYKDKIGNLKMYAVLVMAITEVIIQIISFFGLI